jgi:RNA polymerase sigma factor (sigma-70 family)
MKKEEFEARLSALRPRLHRYCSRMTGSAVNGEDVVQETMMKALLAYGEGTQVEFLDGWMFRIARNASMDFLREKSRAVVLPLTDELEAEALPEATSSRSVSRPSYACLNCSGARSSSRTCSDIRSMRSPILQSARPQRQSLRCNVAAWRYAS